MNVTRQITVRGLRPIMFDRLVSMTEQLAPMDKVYLDSQDKKTLIFPAVNILSFLSSQNTESAPRRLMGKKWGSIAKAALSFVDIDPIEIPFMRDGQKLTRDNAGLTIVYHTARIKKGQLTIPNPKERPLLSLPWELSFTITLMDNPDLTEAILKTLFVKGGISIGWGTFRCVYGKFEVAKWE